MKPKKIKALVIAYTVHRKGYRGPTWELPRTPEAFDRLVEQMARAAFEKGEALDHADYGLPQRKWSGRSKESKEHKKLQMVAALKSAGIERPEGGAR